jgi:CRISPR-associated protein Cst2
VHDDTVYRSLALSFRIELAFHAANNEGAGGTNVMEPRRITVGDKEHDGISGEMIRRHVLQNFVKNYLDENGTKIHSRCQGLVPDRGKLPLIKWMKENEGLPKKAVKSKSLPLLDPPHYPDATKELISNCALCDVGGYLLALEAADDVQGTLKRDSCFEVGWLISEHPAVVDYTQHSAYDPDPDKHNLYVQNIRAGIYGGVMRLDLDRIGFNDWWWLDSTNGKYDSANVLANDNAERSKRISCLLKAVEQWLLSPSFAKQAGWLQHQSGLLEGIAVLSRDGPAPFFSPITLKVDMNNGQPQPKIERNADYKSKLEKLKVRKSPDAAAVIETSNADYKSKLEKLKGEKFELFSFDAPDQFQSTWKDLLDKATKIESTK